MEFLITPFKVMLPILLLFASIHEAQAQGTGIVRDPVLSLDFFTKKRTHCLIKKDYLYLTNKRKSELSKKLKRNLSQSIYKRYKLDCHKSKRIQYVYLFNTLIRTHYMAILVQLNGKILQDFEVVKFSEPSEYKPRPHWLQMLKGKSLSKKINIDGISGATLTTQSIRHILEEIQALEIN